MCIIIKYLIFIFWNVEIAYNFSRFIEIEADAEQTFDSRFNEIALSGHGELDSRDKIIGGLHEQKWYEVINQVIAHSCTSVRKSFQIGI